MAGSGQAVHDETVRIADGSVLLSASQPIWSLPVEAVPAALQSTPQGLSQLEAQRRLER
ncbi:hypothetical protein KBY71_02410, partial [Cyanobium sp. T1B-Tous]|nr:hypothetical protein [Cyanobium sp. T1B-Tous]